MIKLIRGLGLICTIPGISFRTSCHCLRLVRAFAEQITLSKQSFLFFEKEMVLNRRKANFYFVSVLLLQVALEIKCLTLRDIVNNVNPTCDIRVSYQKLESHNFNNLYSNPVSLFSFELFFAQRIKAKTLLNFAKRRTQITRSRSTNCRFNIVDTHFCFICDIPGFLNIWLFNIFYEPAPFDMKGFLISFEGIPFNSYTLFVYHRSLDFLKSKGPHYSLLRKRQSNFDKVLAF